jgi:hypothetical protein
MPKIPYYWPRQQTSASLRSLRSSLYSLNNHIFTVLHFLVLQLNTTDHVRLASVPIDLFLKLGGQFLGSWASSARFILHQRFKFFLELFILLDQSALWFQLLAQIFERDIGAHVQIGPWFLRFYKAFIPVLAGEPILRGDFLWGLDGIDLLTAVDGPILLFASAILEGVDGVAFHSVVVHPHLILLDWIIASMKNAQERQSKMDLQPDEI